MVHNSGHGKLQQNLAVAPALYAAERAAVLEQTWNATLNTGALLLLPAMVKYDTVTRRRTQNATF